MYFCRNHKEIMANRYYIGDNKFDDKNNWNHKEIVYFIGDGFWHEADKWSSGRVPTIKDTVWTTEKTGRLYIGFDKSSIWYKMRKVIDLITFRLTNTMVYRISYSELTIDGGTVVFGGGIIKLDTPVTVCRGGFTVGEDTTLISTATITFKG